MAPPVGGSDATNYIGAMTNFHDLEMTSITGEQVNFDQYKGNLALVVNVASA
jgi:glutathione peroxidase-family protein